MTSPGERSDERKQLLRTPLTELVGIEHPIVQTGMGWVSGPRLTAGTSNAGGLGILASATMTYDELEAAVLRTKELTDKPFGVNIRADATDAQQRIDLLIREKVKVASWGADAVIVQGGEGGGHTGPVATTLLLPSVLDAVDIPVIAAGGFFDGRGLAAALSYGAAGVAMGTRFLLTSDSAVPDSVKQEYLKRGLQDTTVSVKVDGMPHRVLNTDLVNSLEKSSYARGLIAAARNAPKVRAMTGMKWSTLLKEGLDMKKSTDKTWLQVIMYANTPMLLKAGLVDGNTHAGVLASGQVVGLLDDLPTCKDLIDGIIADAIKRIDALSALRA